MFLIPKIEATDNYSVTIVLQCTLFSLDINIIFTFILTWYIKWNTYFFLIEY